MTKPAAKQGDNVIGVDSHVLIISGTPTPTPMPFNGTLDGELSANVLVEHKAAATKGSTATNTPHVPTGGPFQKPPSNKGTVQVGSRRVLINNKEAARAGDKAMTCNDPADAPNGTVVATSTVLMGD